MATALASALTGCKVRRDVAMTGEITLRGHVLPIGGLKEKLLAAHRAGVKEVLIPRENVRDLEQLPAHVREDLDLIAVDSMDEVLTRALVDACGPKISAKRARALKPLPKPAPEPAPAPAKTHASAPKSSRASKQASAEKAAAKQPAAKRGKRGASRSN
jgi:ATP-dependent Lon protease